MPISPTAPRSGAPLRFVFDFGGVLFRWQPRELLRRTLPQRAVDAASADALVAAIFQSFGGDWAQFDRGVIDRDQLVQRISLRAALPLAEVRAVVDAVPCELQPREDTVELLQRLRGAGRRLHYLSNMPLPFAEHLEREHACVGWFDSGVFSSRVRQIKPEPAIFATAMHHFDAAPHELVFIDDMLANVLAARDAGWQALHFHGGAACTAEMQRLGFL
jgi:putative hydrolase of the HAD superfamily